MGRQKQVGIKLHDNATTGKKGKKTEKKIVKMRCLQGVEDIRQCRQRSTAAIFFLSIPSQARELNRGSGRKAQPH
jgi:hypothetical protein